MVGNVAFVEPAEGRVEVFVEIVQIFVRPGVARLAELAGMLAAREQAELLRERWPGECTSKKQNQERRPQCRTPMPMGFRKPRCGGFIGQENHYSKSGRPVRNSDNQCWCTAREWPYYPLRLCDCLVPRQSPYKLHIGSHRRQ